MEWMRSREQMLAGPPAPNALRPSAASGPGGGGTIEMKKESVPKFVLVDANNRVRELTGGAAAAAAMGQQHQQQHNQQMSGGGLSASSFTSLSFGANSKPISMSMPMAMHGHSYHHSHNSYNQRAHHNNDEDFAMTQEELDEQAQLEQQLQVQKEEMRFVSPLPRPQLHGNSSSQRPLLFPNHAYTYSDPNSSQQQFANPLKTPPTVPPVSPFAGLALSAPAKSTIASTGGKLPNPFHSGLSTTVESSPRLPSLNMFRAGSPGQLKMGIAAPRPPPLSLRSSSSDSFTTGSLSSHPSPSPHSTSFSFQSLSVNASPHRHVASSPSPSPMYSQSLPSSTFMHSHEMRKARMSFDGAESVNMSSDDEENGMMLLSSSVERATGGARTGRVCRYADCNNIARSRGLCRTHGGGKRCSHPNCNKSAQANRKCIAHGGGTPCSYGDCEKTAQSRGLCKAHGGGARCKHPDCPKSSQSKGLCRGHGGGIKCKEDGCEKWVQKNGYCIKHGRERSMTS